MGDVADGWHTVIPTSHAGMSRLSQSQLEECERQILRDWEESWHHWSGIGKHVPLTNTAESEKLHERLKLDCDTPLGNGAFGVVQKVKFHANNRPICLARKQVRPPYPRYPLDMLRDEANVMDKLVHEHIVKLVGTYFYRRKLYLLLWPVAVCNLQDFLADIDLLRTGEGDRQDIISHLHALDLKDLSAIDQPRSCRKTSRDRPGCPLQYLRQIMGCITQAIEYCHDADVRHLDLKPSNILLAPGRVYLADFGISKDVHDRENTMTRGMPGTPKWRAPELHHHDTDWSMRAADIYSLGLVFLDIATVIHHAPSDEFDHMLDHVSANPGDFGRLHSYLHKLELQALATQEIDDVNAPTFGPRYVVHLISRMVSLTPSSRPVISQVNNELAELGGVDQVYHSSCCRKSSRWVIDRMNTRLKVVAAERERLRAEHGDIVKQLQVLKAKDETYECRLLNERKVHADNIAKLQAQLDKERSERRRLEGVVAEIEQHQSRRPPRPGISRPLSGPRQFSGTSNPVGSVTGMNMRMPPPSQPLPVPTPPRSPPCQPPQQSAVPSLDHSSRPSYSQAAAAAAAAIPPRTGALAAPPRRDSLIPSPSPGTPIPHNGSSPDLTGYTLRSRTSGSKLPRLINPTTPIRAGTPSLHNRDPESTDSTQYSMSDSIFSRMSLSKASLAGTSVVGTPPPAAGAAAVMDMRRAPSPIAAAEVEARKMDEEMPVRRPRFADDDEAEHGLGLGFTDRERERRESVVSASSGGSRVGGCELSSVRDTASIASSAAIAAGTLSSVPSGSAVSSPRLVHASVEGMRGGGGVNLPPLPTAKSWADVARREKRA
ncbi:kinase-like protein [Parathielavia hyrcaniae]|uniref:non-specific serine/threonine protein kinase n=1 Tax=Parathielavia hyrcaniae TaxID=113614 RepID=A0AAN6SXU3_9PEZI|nr:kinase-like protein [Parathielavia hyrcaniae]